MENDGEPIVPIELQLRNILDILLEIKEVLEKIERAV